MERRERTVSSKVRRERRMQGEEVIGGGGNADTSIFL
jgi:hypothetical protein